MSAVAKVSAISLTSSFAGAHLKVYRQGSDLRFQRQTNAPQVPCRDVYTGYSVWLHCTVVW
jgi:hypothetical protein